MKLEERIQKIEERNKRVERNEFCAGKRNESKKCAYKAESGQAKNLKKSGPRPKKEGIFRM